MNTMFRDHPPTGDRVQKTKETIEQVLPDKDQYVVTTSEFQKVKMALADLEDRGAPNSQERVPSLRRRAPGNRGGVDPDEKDSDKSAKPEDREPDPDDRPTLKRKN